MTLPRRRWFPLGEGSPGIQGARLASTDARDPVDPLPGPKVALTGRVVTMDDTFTVMPDAVVYIDGGLIVAVQDRSQPAPYGFAAVPRVATGGTLYPGLIELHNHLAYNALPLWSPVTRRFEHRGQWPANRRRSAPAPNRRTLNKKGTQSSELSEQEGQKFRLRYRASSEDAEVTACKYLLL